jgi:hypothetical protein
MGTVFGYSSGSYPVFKAPFPQPWLRNSIPFSPFKKVLAVFGALKAPQQGSVFNGDRLIHVPRGPTATNSTCTDSKGITIASV